MIAPVMVNANPLRHADKPFPAAHIILHPLGKRSRPRPLERIAIPEGILRLLYHRGFSARIKGPGASGHTGSVRKVSGILFVPVICVFPDQRHRRRRPACNLRRRTVQDVGISPHPVILRRSKNIRMLFLCHVVAFIRKILRHP